MHDFRLLIDGQLVSGASAMHVINPATEEAFACCPRADAAQLDSAVEAAARAFPGWAALGFAERKQHLLASADALDTRVDLLARTLTMEQGKPLAAAEMEIRRGIGVLRSFACEMLEERTLSSGAHQVTEHRVPLGVVAAITPWNYPFLLLMNKFGPGLIVGNSFVVKPAPTTPLTTLLLGEVLCETLPPALSM